MGQAEQEGILEQLSSVNIRLLGLINDIKHFADLSEQVYDQTYRRVIQGETVPATQKVVSIFEDHTDVIVKDNRDTYYGHKICLTGGVSNLILGCVILEGNPADTDLVEHMLDRQQQFYGRYPLKVAMDGGFASKDNLLKAKERKIDSCTYWLNLRVLFIIKFVMIYRKVVKCDFFKFQTPCQYS